MATSIVVDYERSRLLYRTAHKHGSQALEADALHFRTDMISSTVVLGGLSFVWLGIPQADPFAAMGVAIVIFFVSASLGKRSYDMLTDRAPAGVRERIGEICIQVPGVIECRRVRTRTAGPQLFVDVVVIVDELLARSGAHVIADAIEKGLTGRVERIDVVVHMEPRKRSGMVGPQMDVYSKLQYLAEADPTVRGLHNVRVYDMLDGVHIAADLEMPPSLTLEAAHEAADRFEMTLREQIPNVKNLTLHLESVRNEVVVRNATEETDAIVRFIKTTVESKTQARDCHDIIVREDENGLVLSLDCRAKGSISLIESHTIAERVERMIKEAFPKVNKVFVHLEPLTQD
jgi:divalent metal cation (Fe/Co/Zn/Cd) transporter